MELDIRMLVTLGGMLASVASAAAIARQQIKHLEEEIKEITSINWPVIILTVIAVFGVFVLIYLHIV